MTRRKERDSEMARRKDSEIARWQDGKDSEIARWRDGKREIAEIDIFYKVKKERKRINGELRIENEL